MSSSIKPTSRTLSSASELFAALVECNVQIDRNNFPGALDLLNAANTLIQEDAEQPRDQRVLTDEIVMLACSQIIEIAERAHDRALATGVWDDVRGEICTQAVSSNRFHGVLTFRMFESKKLTQ